MIGGLGSGGIGLGLGPGLGGLGSGEGESGPGGIGCGGVCATGEAAPNRRRAVAAGGRGHRPREDNSRGRYSPPPTLLNIAVKIFSAATLGLRRPVRARARLPGPRPARALPWVGGARRRRPCALRPEALPGATTAP